MSNDQEDTADDPCDPTEPECCCYCHGSTVRRRVKAKCDQCDGRGFFIKNVYGIARPGSVLTSSDKKLGRYVSHITIAPTRVMSPCVRCDGVGEILVELK